MILKFCTSWRLSPDQGPFSQTGSVGVSRAEIPFTPLVISTSTGAIAGDNTAYFLGKRFEQPLRRRCPALQSPHELLVQDTLMG